MKLNSKYLIQTILEVLGGDDISPRTDFEKLLDLAKQDDLGSAMQAWEMHEYFDLSEEQIEQLRNLVAKNIIMNGEAAEVIPKLKELNFDFHNQFTEVYGVTPPRDKQFEVEPASTSWGSDQIAMRLKVGKKNELEFHFWWEAGNPNNPSDPWIYMLSDSREGGDGFLENIYIDWSDGQTRAEFEGDSGTTGGSIPKEEIPGIIRNAMGWTPDEDPPEWPGLPKASATPSLQESKKVTKNYLFQLINEVLREDEEDDMEIEKKINDFIASGDLESFNTGLSLLDTFEMSGLVEPRKAKDLKMLMYKAAKENDLFLDDVGATYNFIMSDEFASSFSDEEMANVKSTVFDILYGTSHESFEKLIEWVIADPNVPFHRYSGSFDLFVIEDIPGQEFVDRVVGKFRELSGQKDFAVFSMADGPEIYIGDDAHKIVNFNPTVKDIFGFKPKSLPSYNFFVGAFTSEIGYGMPFKVDSSPMFDGKSIDYHFKIRNEMGNRWKLTIIFNDGFAGNMQIDYREGHDSYTITLSSHHKNYTSGEGRNAWVTDNPSEEAYTRYNREGMINKVKEMTGIDLTTVGEISESLTEIEENFGATPGGDLLHEAWDSQWPSNFGELKTHIKDFTDKGKVAEDILAKYALEAMTFNHLGPATIWNSYGRLFKGFVRTFVRDESDLTKVRQFINKRIGSDFRAFMMEQFRDARTEKGNEAALRVLNKHVKGLDKQIRQIWRSLEDKGVDWKNIEEEFDREITQAIQAQQFKEANLITSRILEIINFVNQGESDDNAKKLAAFYKKIKQAANSPEIDVSAIADEVSIVRISLEFVEDQLLNIDMTPCADKSADWDKPCVLHQFDDGFFWYDIRADSCDISARKMNNCGEASMSGSELFNLMSYGETGKPKWHIMVEWNEEEKAFIQILGNSNSVPKQEYWPYIKWLYEKWGKPEISNYAWEHVRGDNVKPRVFSFLQYLGLKSRHPVSETWVQMKQQISDGFYNVRSWEGEEPPAGRRDHNTPEGDFVKLWWTPHADRVGMGVRIKRRLIPFKNIESGLFEYEDVRDYKAAGRRLENAGTLGDMLLQDMIPREWDEFFSSEGITQRVRFSHSGNMILYFNWTTKKLQDPSDGNYRDDEYMKQLQREMLARFMNETKQNFSVEQMTKVGKLIGDKLEEYADEWLEKRAAHNRGDDLDEGKRKTKLNGKNLRAAINEVLNESEGQPGYHAMMTSFDDPEQIIHGVNLFATGELNIFIDDTEHDETPPQTYAINPGGSWEEEHGEFEGQDEYIFFVDSKQDALKLQEALRRFYEPITREIYISADWYDGPPRVMLDIVKL